MGMSHAAAVWIPGTDVAPATLEQLVRDSCQHVGLRLDLFVRDTPATTLVVAALDDSPFQMDFGLMNVTAAALARALQRRTYAVYAFFGSGDWMIVTAFDEAGEVAWSEASADEPGGLEAPWRKLIDEVSPGFEKDLLGVGLKPALDVGFIEGWSAVRAFETPGAVDEDEVVPVVAAAPEAPSAPVRKRAAPARKKKSPASKPAKKPAASKKSRSR